MANKYTRRGRDQVKADTSLARKSIKAARSPLSPETVVSFSCNVSGSCCRTDVSINPYDVWRLVHDKEAAAKLGIRTTSDLFGGDQPYFSIYLGSVSRLPQAMIVNRPSDKHGGATVCPFLTPIGDFVPLLGIRPRLTVDNKPMNGCGIYEGRPTVCRSYPFGRLAVRGDGQPENKIIDNREACVPCYSGFRDGPKIPLRQWLKDTGTEEGWRNSDLVSRLHDKICEIKSEDLRFLVGMLLYNFDYPRASQELETEEIERLRPPTFEQHITNVATLVDGILARDMAAVLTVAVIYGLRPGGVDLEGDENAGSEAEPSAGIASSPISHGRGPK